MMQGEEARREAQAERVKVKGLQCAISQFYEERIDLREQLTAKVRPETSSPFPGSADALLCNPVCAAVHVCLFNLWWHGASHFQYCALAPSVNGSMLISVPFGCQHACSHGWAI